MGCVNIFNVISPTNQNKHVEFLFEKLYVNSKTIFYDKRKKLTFNCDLFQSLTNQSLMDVNMGIWNDYYPGDSTWFQALIHIQSK